MNTSKNELTREELIEAQWQWCLEHDTPMFTASNGCCWCCGKDIVDKSWATNLVTGCKYCHRSFVD